MSDHELLMPFVVCQSQDGPYDDEAFVAGYECGRIDGLLAAGNASWSGVVHAGTTRQLDLIAMKHGYVAQFRESEVEGWSYALFTRAEATR